MGKSPDSTPAEPAAKRGDAAWKEHRDAIADRNAAARKRGSAERQVALGRVTERRRLNARREAELLYTMNAKLGKAAPGG